MKKLLFSLTLILLASTLYSQTEERVKGYWLTEEGTSQIWIYKARNGKYYGKIVWLDEPNEDGAPKKDKENPDESLRDKPLMGLLILKGFEFDNKEKEWENGTIYDPKNGKTYDCYMWFENGDYNNLKIKGYVMGMRFIGRETTWKREPAQR